MSTIQCHHCGAPLPVSQTNGVVRCAFCGTERIIGPAPTPAPFPSHPPTTPGSARKVGIGVGLFVVGMLGASAFATVAWTVSSIFSSGRTPSSTQAESWTQPQAPVGVVPAAPTPSTPSPPSFESRACLLADVTGDGAREIGGFIRRNRADDVHPAMIDGATGTIVWEASPTPWTRSQLLCLGERHFGYVDQEEFELAVFPVSGPAGEVRRTLTDELERYGVEGSCVTLRTEDRRTISISLGDGSDVRCAAHPRVRPHIDEEVTTGFVHGIIRMLRLPVVAEHGGMRYELRTRRPGTPFLEVTARGSGRELWTRPLRFVPVGGEAIGALGLAAAPGVVVVAGTERGSSRAEGITLVGLNADTGMERFATPILQGPFARLRGMFYNDRFVVVAGGTALVALDPATGAIAWQL